MRRGDGGLREENKIKTKMFYTLLKFLEQCN